MRACVGQWYSAGLELKVIAQANRFPSGFPGSIPGAGVSSGIERIIIIIILGRSVLERITIRIILRGNLSLAVHR